VPSKVSEKKVAIVHDWLYGGGAEQVILAMHELYPEAPIYTSYCTKEWRKKLDNKVVTGWLQHWPFSALRKYIPFLRIYWFTHLDLTKYDIVISSSGNGEAKGVNTRKDALHLLYCHTPTHFYWRHYSTYLKSPGFGIFNPLAKLGLKLLVGPLRKWDYKAAQKADIVIANSKHIKDDILNYYGRKAVVIHPPVDTERFKIKFKNRKRKGLITVGRQTPYKNTDIVVKAANKLKMPLKVVGNGPEHENLEDMAKFNINFITDASNQDVQEYLATSELFVFAAHEDFGIAPVEAMASGTPVVAYGQGGALDYVNSKTGVLFSKQTVGSASEAINKALKTKWDSKLIARQANKFSKKSFQTKLKKLVEKESK
jgi:glycosyltransferase involved in cell wall biosynthesis